MNVCDFFQFFSDCNVPSTFNARTELEHSGQAKCCRYLRESERDVSKRISHRSCVHAAISEQLKKFGKQYKSHVKRTDAPLIFSAKGGGFNAQTIINLFQKLYEEAGISGASSHSGRRQFVTELADKGINARVIQALARHRHLNTTMRYIDINENKMRNAIETSIISF